MVGFRPVTGVCYSIRLKMGIEMCIGCEMQGVIPSLTYPNSGTSLSSCKKSMTCQKWHNSYINYIDVAFRRDREGNILNA